MKKIFFLFLLLPFLNLYGQWDFGISMGLDFKSAPAYRDYINFNFASPDNKLKSFNSSVNFSGEAGYLINKSFQIGLEYSIVIDSYNSPLGSGGIYEISYLMHRPSVIGYYVIGGAGYKFKFGGGLGLRFVSLNEEIITKSEYESSGWGLLIKGEANTLLSGNLYVLLGLDFRYDLPGELSSDENKKITNFATGEIVNLNAISIGVKLGISYLL